MTLEEMLRQEREGIAPNPLAQRVDEIVTRVRRRRRLRAAAVTAVSLVALGLLPVVAGQLLADQPEVIATRPTPDRAVPLSEVPADAPLDPGRYVVSVDNAPSAPRLPVLSVPQGFEGIESTTGVRTDDLARYLWVWDVDSVFTHPCDAAAEPVGPSVADLAQALSTQPLRSGTDPVPVTVGGYDGLYVELTVPQDLAAGACPSGIFSLWPGRAQRWQEIRGQVDTLWIVDVEGQRLVFDAAHLPDVSPDDVAELHDMVTTATFADGA
jgi:hypothetical protein